MANILDYVAWRGDLRFSDVPPNAVDALIFSTLTYIPFPSHWFSNPVSLQDAARMFLASPDAKEDVRGKNDLCLLQATAASERFGSAMLTDYQQVLNKDKDTQFAALTFLLEDDSIFISFRGTDNTLVGWKEDFSMCFRQEIPSQRLARQYLQDALLRHSGTVRISGHSKGGNVAVYALSQCTPVLRKRVLEVYNQDGPGFSREFLKDPGYQAIVPKIRTLVPQSSVIGMLLYRLEDICVVKSNQVGIMQHDPFSWEVMGATLIPMEGITGNARFLQLTIENWLLGMDYDCRVRMVNMLFDLLTSGDVEVTGDIFLPKNLVGYIAKLRSSEMIRKYLAEDLTGLFRAAKKARLQMDSHK